jgi:cytochrome P450
MYGSHVKSLELFTKTEINDFGDERGGLVFERDPVQHRKVAKQISPAFSSRSITAKEHIVQEYIDYFVEQMKISGDSSTGIDFKDWTNWLAMDISADITYSRKLGQMRDSKSSKHNTKRDSII